MENPFYLRDFNFKDQESLGQPREDVDQLVKDYIEMQMIKEEARIEAALIELGWTPPKEEDKNWLRKIAECQTK